VAGSVKILLVEDEPVVAMVLRRVLEDNGYSVTTTPEGKIAVKTVRLDPSIQLVLMDIELGPGMDGPETAKAILAERMLPVVFLSSHSSREMVERVRGITRYGYVVKDSGRYVLLSSIEMALEMFAAHEKTRDSERRLAHLFQSSPFAILVLDAEDHLIDCNREFTRMFQFSLEEARGRQINELIVPSQLADEGNELSRNVTEGRPIYRETQRCRKDGSLVEVAITGAPIDLDNGRVIYGIYQDIGERNAAQARINELLSEKELLLREVYHRVKNNMHSISVLLSLQAESAGLPEVEAAMNDARGRVASMQMVYDKLFSSEDFHKVSSSEYLGDLVDDIILSSSAALRIIVHRELDDVSLDADTLFPLGLIMNEALTNAFKYAFPNNRGGRVAIRFTRDGQGNCELAVDDDGIGLDTPVVDSSTPPSPSSTGFGLTLIHALADQLAGTATLTGSSYWKIGSGDQPGTRVSIQFPYGRQYPGEPSQEVPIGQ
jgi:PAS domain S-box-containing protein